MKKITAVILLLCIMQIPVPVRASEGTTYTYTISLDGNWIRTQDAYLPGQVYLLGAGLKKSADLFIKGDLIYISDSGNSRIAVFSKVTGEITYLGDKILKSPRGIFVDAKGNIYVADYDAECIFELSKDGELLRKIGRPDSYLFSPRSRFKPTGVAVTSGNIIYVTGEGSYEGIMQFNQDGEFQGYFAANMTDMTMLERLQELIFTKKQLDRLFTRTPRAIQNIDITDRDLLYSVTQDAGVTYSWRAAKRSSDNNVKLHNLAGVDILDKSKSMVQEWNFVDVAAGPYGNCFALTYTGIINEYDGEGVYLPQEDYNILQPEISFYFLTGDEADYSGMAVYYRKLLEKEGVFHTERVDTVVPVRLDILGADVKKGFLHNPLKTFTTVNATEGISVINGFAYDSIGYLLYSDYTRNHFITRPETLASVTDFFKTMSGALALYRPNQYLWQYTEEYFDIPMVSSQYLYETDTVPFLQIVLKGHIDYYAPYANLGFYSVNSILKMIEYGTYPSFIIADAQNHELTDTPEVDLFTVNFDDWKGSIQSIYSQINASLSRVEGSTITKHEVVAPGVVSVLYDNGIVIYVNYTSTAFKTDDVMVPALGFAVAERQE